MYPYFHELLADRTGGRIFRCFGPWHFFWIALTAAVCVLLYRALSKRDAAIRAIDAAVAAGVRRFAAIAVVGGHGDSEEPCPPCGVCLQVMAEFCDADEFTVYLVKNENECETVKLRDLLPVGFGKKRMK